MQAAKIGKTHEDNRLHDCHDDHHGDGNDVCDDEHQHDNDDDDAGFDDNEIKEVQRTGRRDPG